MTRLMRMVVVMEVEWCDSWKEVYDPILLPANLVPFTIKNTLH